MRPGQIIADRFEIIAEAGIGGMGRVYHARDLLVGDEVALKILVSANNAYRFLREGELLSGLSDPGIVRYIAHGHTGTDELFLAMEWLEGEDLSSRIARSPLGSEETRMLGVRIAKALGAAHRQGVVHRDVKPGNIFLPDGDLTHAKILDFGIAHWASGALTNTGSLLGTPGYIAPEQAKSDRTVDARADVFALGCLLYECLTGQPAFAGDKPMAVLAKVLFEEAPKVRELRPDVSPAFEALIDALLSKEPDDRPVDGDAAASALLLLEDGAPTNLTTAPAPTGLGTSELRFLAVLLTRPSGEQASDTADTLPSAEPSALAIVRNTVSRFGGTAEPLIDGSIITLLARGPSSGLDRAVQAARCALQLRRLLPTAAHVLAMGRGDLSFHRPVGEVIDRAAALLETAASEGEVHVDADTAAVLESRFAVQAGPPIRLLREHPGFEASRTLLGRPVECVGRSAELNMLEGWFQSSVADRQARAVVVRAPAGTGKSRLAQELVLRLRERDPALEVWVARGDPTRAGSAFGMLAPLVRRAAGIRDGEPAERSQRKLAARLASRVDEAELEQTTTFLAELIGARFSQEERPLLVAARRDPKILGEHMRRAFQIWLAAECATEPLLLALEDLHWGDLPTVRFIAHVLRELEDRPLFVLALARPEIDEFFPRLWEAEGAVGLRLGGLAKKAGEALVRQALGPQTQLEVMDRLLRRAGGNAFFLEELIRAHSEGNDGRLPETVLAVATVRLERQPQATRRVLRAASIYGETFSHAGVSALLDDASDVDSILQELIGLELIVRRPRERRDGPVYAFRHGLMRDAAYAMLTDADRRIGHRLAGRWLEESGGSEARSLATHYERGDDPIRATKWYTRAAAQALDANDFGAVLAQGQKALDLEGTEETRRDAHEFRGTAYMGLGRWQEAPAELQAALALVDDQDAERRTNLSLKLARASFFAFDVEAMRTHATNARTLAEQLGRADLTAGAIAGLGAYQQTAGDLDAAKEAYDQAKRVSRSAYLAFEAQLLLGLLWRGDTNTLIDRGRLFVEQARDVKDIFGLMVALPQLGLGLAAKGQYEEAQRVFDHAVEVGERHATLTLVARALAMSAGYRLDVRDYARAHTTATEALEMARSLDYPPTVTSMGIDLLFHAARTGDVGRGEVELGKVSELVAATAGKGWHGWLFKMRLTCACAELALARKEPQGALELASDVLVQSQAYGRLKYQVAARTIQGRALDALSRRKEAIDAWTAGAEVARRLGDPAIMLHVLIPLLPVGGTDALLGEAQQAKRRIREGLSPEMKQVFLASDGVRQITED